MSLEEWLKSCEQTTNSLEMLPEWTIRKLIAIIRTLIDQRNVWLLAYGTRHSKEIEDLALLKIIHSETEGAGRD